MKYVLYLFKEKDLKVKKAEIFTFFKQYREVNHHISENKEVITLDYKNNVIGCAFRVVLAESLLVPNISKLDGNYKSLAAYIEIPIVTTDYAAEVIIDIIGKLCSKLSIALYNQLFENILPFRQNVVKTTFMMFKDKFKKTDKSVYNRYYMMEKNKLNEILKFSNQSFDLIEYFKSNGFENIIVPKYMFVENNYRPYSAIEWNVKEEIVFPPKLDMIYFITEDDYQLYYAKDLLTAIEKVVDNVPGYISARMITKKALKKVPKLIKKAKLLPVEFEIKPINLSEIIDF